MIDISDADIIARGDSIDSFVLSDSWRRYLQPWMADYRELLRDQIMDRATRPEGLSAHYAAFLAGQERMIEVLVTQLSDWRNQRDEILKKGGEDTGFDEVKK